MSRKSRRGILRDCAVAILSATAWWLGSIFSLIVAFDYSNENIDVETETVFIDNYNDGDEQSYSLALLKGHTTFHECRCVMVENLSSSKISRVSSFAVFQGKFKLLVELVVGENVLTITDGYTVRTIRITYKKSSNPYIVRLVCFVDSETELTDDYVQKIRIAGLLWQTATAESFYEAGLGRRTFTLEFDEKDNVVIWVQQAQNKAAEYSTLTQAERFKLIYREVVLGNIGTTFAKYFVFIHFSKQNFQTQSVKVRTALGGGGMGMLDTHTLFSWPSTIEAVIPTFLNDSSISQQLLYDSAYRNYYWALVSSSLGSGLHELGHALGLEHLEDPNDFMSRGFDKLNRIFTNFEPRREEPNIGFPEWDHAKWGQVNIAKLLHSSWIEE